MNTPTPCDDMLECGILPTVEDLERMPVYTEPGDSAPRAEGESFYFTTPSGKTIVRHPNAYGWRTLYWPSTRRVVVGRQWLAIWRRMGGVMS